MYVFDMLMKCTSNRIMNMHNIQYLCKKKKQKKRKLIPRKLVSSIVLSLYAN